MSDGGTGIIRPRGTAILPSGRGPDLTVAPDTAGKTVVVTSTVPDRLNNNSAIRGYAAAACRLALPGAAVLSPPVEAAASVIRRAGPCLVIAIGGVAVDGDHLRQIKAGADQAGAPLALWLHDDPYEFDYAFRSEAVADVIFTNDAWAQLHYRHPRVHHLPLAGCMQTHYRPITDAARETELFFCGHAHGNRTRFFREARTLLSRFDVQVSGTGWPADLPFAINRRMRPAEMADGASRAVLTLSLSRTDSIANRRFDLPASTPGPRVYEVALAGSAQLCWGMAPAVEDSFQPDREILLVESLRELRQALERAREEPDYFVAMARAAQRRALGEHCYEHRIRRLWALTFPQAAVGAPGPERPGILARTVRPRRRLPGRVNGEASHVPGPGA